MNYTGLQGRLTKDIELRDIGNGKVVTGFNVAVDRPFKNAQGERETDFISVVAFNKTAELIEQYFKKGDGIIIQGRIQTRNYENSQSQRVYVTEVVAESFNFPIQNRQNNQSNQSQGSTNYRNNQSTNTKNDFVDDDPGEIDDDDLPF